VEVPEMRPAPVCFAALIFTALACAPPGEAPPVEPPNPDQAKADAAEWRWSEREASLLYSLQHSLSQYEVQVVRPGNKGNPWTPLTVRILDLGQEVYSFRAHDKTVFTQLGDTVFVADFSPRRTGCTIVAFDLKARKEMWKCPLVGNPPEWHSEYEHEVNITTDGDAVLVYGKESNGRYIEYVDAKTGKTVGHKKLPPND
jgi:hypothetical protein